MTTRKHLRSQGKEIIAKVYHRMKYEAINGVEKVTDARWRTSQAVGVSEKTITNILREERIALASTSAETQPDVSEIFKSPTRKRSRPKSKLDDFDVTVLRRTIMTFRTDYKEPPTLRKLKEVLAEKIGFDGCLESLRRVLRDSGYERTPIDDKRKALVEKHDIQMMRFKYLTQLNKYRDEGRYIVFTGGSYIDTKKNTQEKAKKAKEQPSLQKKPPKGMRAIIVHAGGCNGFVPNACLIYKANSVYGGYHDNITFENYKTWLTNQLLPNLPENAVIVIDSGSHNDAVSEKCPTFDSDKNIMQAWLTEKNIPFEDSMKKIELYDLILKNQDSFKSYIIDELCKSKGFEVLRIPPFHSDLNPIENIWGILKSYMTEGDVEQNIATIMALLKKKLELIDLALWENTCRHIEHVEKQYLQSYDMDCEYIDNANETDTDDSDFMDMTDYLDC